MEIAAAPVSPAPRTVEDIYKDFSNRRAALVRALTVDVDEFFGYCDPEKENLCLYGYSNGRWEVALPAEEVPPEMPEPALGINFARDGMHRRDWLSLVAVHSDSWLLSIAFFFGARLNANERYGPAPIRLGLFFLTSLRRLKRRSLAPWNFWKRLFSMINDQPTVLESLSERKHGRDNKSGVENSSKSRHSAKRANNDMQTKNSRPGVVDDAYEDDDEHSETLCGTCGGRYNASEFWIGCDICERWFHGKCVRITPAKAEHIKHYKCPDCSSKKGRQ